MSDERLAAIKARILEACRKVQGEGVRIGCGGYGVEYSDGAWRAVDGCCCPLGAVVLAGQPAYPGDDMGGASVAVKGILGIEKEERFDFWREFDAPGWGMGPFATMAREIRKELGL